MQPKLGRTRALRRHDAYPFEPGAGTIAGRISYFFASISAALLKLRDGRVLALVVISGKRYGMLPASCRCSRDKGDGPVQLCSKNRCASSAAMHPVPADVMAWR